MTQKTLKLNDDWDLFVDTKGDLSVTDKSPFVSTNKSQSSFNFNVFCVI